LVLILLGFLFCVYTFFTTAFHSFVWAMVDG